MSFLFPLYLAAGLAVGLPILFHLIRQTPKGRQVFSSTMFLSPSPPRVTKRSRIEDWLLLLLRGLALILIACAFSRPFLRAQELEPGEQKSGQRFLVLIDTSASLHRGQGWEEVRQKFSDFLDGLGMNDTLAIMSFDESTRDVLSFQEWTSAPPVGRASLAISRFESLEPSWLATELGNAMIEAAERLQEQSDETFSDRNLVVISDFQAGSRWTALQSFQWPADVQVTLLPVLQEPSNNAAIHLVQSQDAPDDRPRVRVTNSPDSLTETFLLGWLSPHEPRPTDPATLSGGLRITVPVGQSRVVATPVPPEGVTGERLVLVGDGEAFDNIQYVVPGKQRTIRLEYIGDATPSEVTDPLRGFLGPMFPDVPARRVAIVSNDEGPESCDFALIAGEPNQARIEALSDWLRSGGKGLFVSRNPEQSKLLSRLLQVQDIPVEEADVPSYRMIGKVDLSHPLLIPFDDPRYADFTKVRIWHHRRFDLSGVAAAGMRVLMSFDDGSPALVEFDIGKGRLYLLATSWGREDSEFAVWSKFIPIMNGMLDLSLGGDRRDRTRAVGESVSHGELNLGSGDIQVRLPVTPAPDTSRPASPKESKTLLSPEQSFTFSAPGLYEFRSTEQARDNGTELKIAVNLAADESRTAPLDLELLRGAGVPLKSIEAASPPKPVDPMTARQLLNRELESRQQWWRWLLIVALGLLLCETILSSLLTWWRTRPTPATV